MLVVLVGPSERLCPRRYNCRCVYWGLMKVTFLGRCRGNDRIRQGRSISRRHDSFSSFDDTFFHRLRPVNAMKLVVEAYVTTG